MIAQPQKVNLKLATWCNNHQTASFLVAKKNKSNVEVAARLFNCIYNWIA